MDYFSHNAITEGRARVRAEFRRYVNSHVSGFNYGALFATATDCIARRLEGARLHKRARTNELPAYLYSGRQNAYAPKFLRVA
jgi:hypothetical protein